MDIDCQATRCFQSNLKMISFKNNQFPISPSLILSSFPPTAPVQVVAKDGPSQLPPVPLLLLSPLLRPLLLPQSPSSPTFTISLPSFSASLVTKLGQLLEQGAVKVESEEEAGELKEAAAVLGLPMENAQFVKTSQQGVFAGNGGFSQDHTKEKLLIPVDVNDIEPVKSSMKPVRVVLRGIAEANSCDLCGKKLMDRNASKMHMKIEHKEIHTQLENLCIKKVSNPTDATSISENCLGDFSDNLDDARESDKRRRDGHQRSSNATFPCILCNTKYRSKWNLKRHVRGKHAQANQDALLKLVDELEEIEADEEENGLNLEEEIQQCSQAISPRKDDAEEEEDDLPELLFDAAAQESLLCEPTDLENKSSKDNEILISEESCTETQIINAKPGDIFNVNPNDIICIGPAEDTEIDVGLSNVLESSTSADVECCLLCGAAPRHQYVLWEHYLRNHFR